MENQVELKENQTPPYTLRSVQGTDIFAMLKILKKIGIKNIQDAFNSADEQNRGYAMFDVLVDRLSDCEQEICEFLGKLSNMEAQEIARQSADIFMSMIWDVFDDPKFMDFLKVALRRLE